MGDLGTLLLIILTLAIVAYYRIPGLRAWVQRRRYVDSSQPVPTPEPIAINRQSDAVNRHQTDPVQQTKPRFEPTRFTKSELVRFLALAVIEEDDGNTHPLSQEAISRAAGISKVTAAAMIAEARGQPEPVAVDDMQLVKMGPRENYVRAGVKPLR